MTWTALSSRRRSNSSVLTTQIRPQSCARPAISRTVLSIGSIAWGIVAAGRLFRKGTIPPSTTSPPPCSRTPHRVDPPLPLGPGGAKPYNRLCDADHRTVRRNVRDSTSFLGMALLSHRQIADEIKSGAGRGREEAAPLDEVGDRRRLLPQQGPELCRVRVGRVVDPPGIGR